MVSHVNQHLELSLAGLVPGQDELSAFALGLWHDGHHGYISLVSCS